MQRDVLLITEMIEAAGRAQELTSGITAQPGGRRPPAP